MRVSTASLRSWSELRACTRGNVWKYELRDSLKRRLPALSQRFLTRLIVPQEKPCNFSKGTQRLGYMGSLFVGSGGGNHLDPVCLCRITASGTSAGKTAPTTSCASYKRNQEYTCAHTCSARWRPSNVNGVVTMPTVKMPMSLAMEATTCAAPLPVPPPMPAVTNTMSAPCSANSMASRLSRAAFCV
eukprot:1149776-Pelagomonas_calceolata.AAC.4